ncbi:MAG: sugar phosphate isomerase/epimerase family protein [Bryobacteraceae bacterium]
MTRREILSVAASFAPRAAARSMHGLKGSALRLGATPAAFGARAKGTGGTRPFDVVERCRELGLGGVETTLQAIELDLAAKLGQRIRALGLDLILESPPLPVEEGQLYRYDFALGACKAAGARCLRTALGGRRYEQFESATAFQRGFERLKSQVSLAVPMLEKNRVRLAIENHGDWRAAELANWLDRLGCEYVGVCFDFGESMALCEDPMDTLRTLNPYIFMCHIKDVAVDSYEDGFLMSEVPLGEGILNLKEMVRMLRSKDPAMPFYLDGATRDPVKVPVSTAGYRGFFSDKYSPLPDKDVANVLELVRKNRPKTPLPQVSGLSPAAAVKLEDERNQRSIEWARKNLEP